MTSPAKQKSFPPVRTAMHTRLEFERTTARISYTETEREGTAKSSRTAELTGKVAVILGATSGIGLALALHAAARGMQVVLADADQAVIDQALQRVAAKTNRVLAIRADVTDLDAVRTLACRTEYELGLPWLVCNTSINNIESNLRSVVHGIQVFAPGLIQRRRGHPVNVVLADPGRAYCRAAYAATAHAIVGLSESLYRELDCMGSPVGVTLVCPSTSLYIRTSLASCLARPERHRPMGFPPEALAEQIFASISARNFRIVNDTPDVCTLSFR